MRRLVLALLVLSGAAVSGAGAQAPGPSEEARAVAALPAELGAFRRAGEVRDLEALPNGRGLGATVTYVPANGERMHATIAIYGRSPTEGADGPEVLRELRAFETTMTAMVRMGRYQSAAFATAMQIGGTAAAPGIRCANYNVVQQAGQRTADSICVTAQHGQFVKVRLTAPNEVEPVAAGIFASGLTASILAARAAGRPR